MQVIIAHRAAAQRMRGDQMAELEKAPGRIGYEAAAQCARMPSQFLIHTREDLLLAGMIPGDAYAAVGLCPWRFKEDGAAGVVLAHHQVKHRVNQRSVPVLERIEEVQIVQQPL